MTHDVWTLEGVAIEGAAVQRLLPAIIEAYVRRAQWSREVGLRLIELVIAHSVHVHMENSWDEWFAFCHDLPPGTEVRSFRDLLEDPERF